MTGIESVIAFLGLLFAVILSGLALWNKIAKWLDRRAFQQEKRFKAMVIAAVKEYGLIKEGNMDEVWPNGSTNMPDFLRTVWETMEATQAGLHAIQERLDEK